MMESVALHFGPRLYQLRTKNPVPGRQGDALDLERARKIQLCIVQCSELCILT
jgi:hypothetical protein